MQSTIVMINLLGAVALLLVGLAQVKDGVSRAFGARLRTGLATATRRSWRAFVSGLVATLALQSSTATALMVSSFVERSLVKPRMAQIVLLGANLGTALTAWIVSTGIEWLSPLLILCGFALTRSAATARQGGGVALIGIGLMLLSLHLLDQASAPMRHSAALATFIRLLDGAWPVAFAFSAGLAFACSSSLAIVVLILSLASTACCPAGCWWPWCSAPIWAGQSRLMSPPCGQRLRRGASRSAISSCGLAAVSQPCRSPDRLRHFSPACRATSCRSMRIFSSISSLPCLPGRSPAASPG